MVMATASNQTMAFYSSTSNPSIQRSGIQFNTSNKGKRIGNHQDMHLPNFGITESELFKDLCSRGLMCPKPGKKWAAPFPAWYQADLTCIYHWGTPGHSIESCEQFKKHVWSLLDAGQISVRGPIVRNGVHKEVTHKTLNTGDTKRWDLKMDDPMLKEKNLELREDILRLKEENLGLRQEGQRLKDELTRMHYDSERRELELCKENETYRFQLMETQSRLLGLTAKLRALEGQVISGEAQVEEEPEDSRIWEN